MPKSIRLMHETVAHDRRADGMFWMWMHKGLPACFIELPIMLHRDVFRFHSYSTSSMVMSNSSVTHG
jgi:hypothetical protein